MIKRAITIAGGGIAGLALGIALRGHDLPVTVIEAASYPRHRVCGEFISGITPEDLETLGISGVMAGGRRHRGTSWFEGDRCWARAELPSAAYGISRYFLDQALAERFQKLGGELRCGMRWNSNEEGVVWATGRLRGDAEWLGLKAHYENLEVSDDLEIHLGDAGYVGLTRVEDARVNVCGLFRTERIQGEDPLIAACEAAGFKRLAGRLRESNRVDGSAKGVSNFAFGWQPSDPARMCVGDAAVMIPPFTGNGMAIAMQSALAAAEEIIRWGRGEANWDESVHRVRMQQRKQFGRRVRCARILQAMMVRRPTRRLGMGILASGLIPFDTIYQSVR
jgi:flavin-dependent dehydrogenase